MVFVRQKLHSEVTVEIYVTFSYTLLSNKGGIALRKLLQTIYLIQGTEVRYFSSILITKL